MDDQNSRNVLAMQIFRRQPAPRVIATIFVAVLLLAVVCHGTVFQRWKTASSSTSAMTNLGGHSIYNATIDINGAPGNLTIFSFNDNIKNTIKSLDNAFPASQTIYQQGNMGHLFVQDPKTHLRIHCCQFTESQRTTAFKIEQTARDANASSSSPARHLMKIVPEYPQSKQLFFARDDNARMSLSISHVPASESAILQFYQDHLLAQGWNHAIADTQGNAPRIGISTFYKEGTIFCVNVSPSVNDDGNTITLLHKQYGQQ